MTRPRSYDEAVRYRLTKHYRQSGLTLVELMISITLGLLVVLAATALLVSSKTAYTSQDDGTRLQDSGRYALEIIGRALRQGAYESWDTGDGGAPIVTTSKMSANLSGLDAKKVSATSTAIDTPLTAPDGRSDVLAVRFFGSGSAGAPDNTMIDCAGMGISQPTSQSDADAGRGWSIFYVDTGISGEPELYCKTYPDGGGSWTAQPIASGVESFQVLYGLDTDADHIPNQFVTATAINALDTAAGVDNTNTNWKKVVSVKVALLVRGTASSRSDSLTKTYDLFSADYSAANAATDIGTQISEATLPAASRNRQRKVFQSTTQFRNQAEGSGK